MSITRVVEAKRALEALMDGPGFTQEEIARDLGVSARTVSRWWNGHSTISAKHLKDLIRLAAED